MSTLKVLAEVEDLKKQVTDLKERVVELEVLFDKMFDKPKKSNAKTH